MSGDLDLWRPDRDLIAESDREALLRELASGMAEAMRDASTEQKEGWVRDGYPALNWRTTKELRREMYEWY